MEQLCESNKRYRKQMFFWAVIYCSVTYASVYLLKHFTIGNLGVRTLIALFPMVPITFAGRIIIKFIRDLDELQQKIQLEAVIFSAVTTALVTCAYGFMEGVGYPELDTVWIMPMLMVLWVLGQILARRRYQ
jgi:Na+/melibiose symporter-like transporter